MSCARRWVLLIIVWCNAVATQVTGWGNSAASAGQRKFPGAVSKCSYHMLPAGAGAYGRQRGAAVGSTQLPLRGLRDLTPTTCECSSWAWPCDGGWTGFILPCAEEGT